MNISRNLITMMRLRQKNGDCWVEGQQKRTKLSWKSWTRGAAPQVLLSPTFLFILGFGLSLHDSEGFMPLRVRSCPTYVASRMIRNWAMADICRHRQENPWLQYWDSFIPRKRGQKHNYGTRYYVLQCKDKRVFAFYKRLLPNQTHI